MNKRVAIVAHRATDLIHGDSETEPCGGAEIQSYYVARLLSEKYNVQFIVKESLASVKSDFKHISVLYTYSEKSPQARYIRFIYPRLIKNLKAIWRAKSDIYYQRGPGEITGITAIFCKLFNRRFIYAVSGNGELADLKVKIRNPIARLLYKTGLFLSDTILCQSQDQIQLLTETQRNKAVILRNIYPYEASSSDVFEKKCVLNIGSHRALKRQHIFFKLAKEISNVPFVCIGGGTGQFADKLQDMAKSIPNLQLTGHIPHESVIAYLRSSYCLVNCSNNEGFPNIFLEAWACGIPIISLGFDPDGIIKRYSLGLAVQSIEELVEGVNLLISNPDARDRFVENGIKYIQQFHSNEAITNQFYKIIG